jgi:hypothetical protein
MYEHPLEKVSKIISLSSKNCLLNLQYTKN